ncbi:Uncharacterized protein FKW44_007092 [Caligus rogercresseyi]|uniref:Uncharacterized protein n=1 Tax=Caligus rogercresseyi TaxID=217165 RepID=A0A7T8KE88_CALRO|nr:Uncharacterized protein FKW44_007092 [Caligus rogercresseyi]
MNLDTTPYFITEAKNELDIPGSVKVSSTSDGHSRSLLSFSPGSLKPTSSEFVSSSAASSCNNAEMEQPGGSRKVVSTHFDHDYLSSQRLSGSSSNNNITLRTTLHPEAMGPAFTPSPAGAARLLSQRTDDSTSTLATEPYAPFFSMYQRTLSKKGEDGGETRFEPSKKE